MDIKHFVTRGNFAHFDNFRSGVFYYNIQHVISLERYQFQIPVEDIGGAPLMAIEKSVFMMRWIKKSLEDKTLIKL
jgi:hypothetical protein